jgi:hypothetical protein
MFYEFNTLLLLLPEFKMSVYRCRDEEIGSEGDIVIQLITFLRLPGEATYFVTTQKLMTSRCMKLL